MQDRKRIYIRGFPFYETDLDDVAECSYCGEHLDVGGELADHIARHDEEMHDPKW